MKKLLFLFVLLAACQSDAPITDADREAIKQQIENKLAAAFFSASPDDLRPLYTTDAISMPPNDVEKTGLDEVVKRHSAPSPVTPTTMTLSTVEVEGSGDKAYVRGTWSFTGKLDTLEISDNGKFMSIMKKEGNEWKIFRETWNTNLPLPQN